jgi:hypothetical protein
MSTAENTSLWSLAVLHVRSHRTAYSVLATLWTGFIAYSLFVTCHEHFPASMSTSTWCGTCAASFWIKFYIEGPFWLLTSVVCCRVLKSLSVPLHRIARLFLVASGGILFAPIGAVLFLQFVER